MTTKLPFGNALRAAIVAADRLFAWVFAHAEVFSSRGGAASGCDSVPVLFKTAVARVMPLGLCSTTVRLQSLHAGGRYRWKRIGRATRRFAIVASIAISTLSNRRRGTNFASRGA